MAIEKYATISLYGFGFTGKRGGEAFFIEKDQRRKLSIIVGGLSREFDTGMQRIKLKGRDNSKDYPGEVLYGVLENGEWKEYFTGTKLRILDDNGMDQYSASVDGTSWRIGFKTDENSLDQGNCTLSLEDIGSPMNQIEDVYHMGLREFACMKGSIQECTPQQFADYLAGYQEAEIQSMVSQFYDLQEKATNWGARFEKEVMEILKEGNHKGARLRADLESRLGAYARKATGPDPKVMRKAAQENTQKVARKATQEVAQETVQKAEFQEGSPAIVTKQEISGVSQKVGEHGMEGSQLSEESIQHMLEMMGEKDTPDARARLMENLSQNDAADLLFEKLRSNREIGVTKKQSLGNGKEENKTNIIILLVAIIFILIVICAMK